MRVTFNLSDRVHPTITLLFDDGMPIIFHHTVDAWDFLRDGGYRYITGSNGVWVLS